MANAVWTFIYKMGSPRTAYAWLGKVEPWLFALALPLLAWGLVWGLAFAPPDYQQGDAFRIIYVHVPSAFLSMSCYASLAIAGLLFLVWKVKLAEYYLRAAAPIGAVLTLLALLTGAIWGRPMWGAWWAWDARLISELILLFLYLGLMALGSAIEDRAAAARAMAILAIVGVINLPIIHYSVYWWNSVHQGSTLLRSDPQITKSMAYPLLLSLGGCFLLFLALACAGLRNQILIFEQRSQWLRQLLGAK